MLNSILDNPLVWDSCRYVLDITCGLYRKRISYLRNLDIFHYNPSVLDIGCGTGLFGDVTKGCYVGIDIDCQSIQYAKRKKFTTDYYLGVFGNYHITVKKNVKLKYPNIPSSPFYQGTFIIGVDIVNDVGENLEDEF